MRDTWKMNWLSRGLKKCDELIIELMLRAFKLAERAPSSIYGLLGILFLLAMVAFDIWMGGKGMGK